MNLVQKRVLEKNYTDPTPFAISGNDGASYGGFYTFSSYLLQHPVLTPTEKLILQFLTYRCENYDALAECHPVDSKATQEEILGGLGISRSNLAKSIGRLQTFELIDAYTQGRQKRYTLLPGPWPRLGDRPEKGSTWRDFTFNLLASVKAWSQALPLTWSDAVGFLTTPKKSKNMSTKNTSEEGSTPQDMSTRNTYFDGDTSAKNTRPDPVENPVEARPGGDFLETPRGRAHARGVINNRDTQGSSRERPAVRAEGSVPGRAQAGTPAERSEDSETPTSPAERTRLVDRELKHKSKQKPKRTAGPRRQFMTTYRQRLREEFDIEFGAPTKRAKKQIKRACERNGDEFMLAALDWLFDNWTYLKRTEGKLYTNDRYPPLRAIVSAALIDKYRPYIEGKATLGQPGPGEQRKVGEGNNYADWYGAVQARDERPEDFYTGNQQDLEDLL